MHLIRRSQPWLSVEGLRTLGARGQGLAPRCTLFVHLACEACTALLQDEMARQAAALGISINW